MKHTIVLISCLLMTFGCFRSLAQDIPKDTIYLEFKPNDGTLPHYRGKKFTNKYGINFNLYSSEGLLFPKGNVPDTLCYKHLKDYPITNIENIDSLSAEWTKRNLELLQKKWGKIFPPHKKNGKFATYIIEKFEDYFVLYRVYWRNQRP